MEELGRDEWAHRFAARLRGHSTRVTAEEAVKEGDSLFGLLADELGPEEAADALVKREPEYRGGMRVR